MVKKIAAYGLSIVLLLGLITTAEPINPVGNSIAGAAIGVTK